MVKKLGIMVVIAAMVLSTFTACGTKETKATESKVGTWKTAQTIQPFFYQDFLDKDDKIQVVPFTNPGDMKAALLAGSIDMCGTTVVTAIMAASKGEPIKIVCGLSNKCSALVVGSDSGITQPSQLKGKTLAYVPGTMHHILLLETLVKAGLNPDKDVTLVRIDFFDMGTALSKGEIDGFYSGEPYPSIAVAEGYGKIIGYPTDDKGVGTINSCMITTDDQIKNHSDKIQKLVTAHVKATDFLTKNKDKWGEKTLEFGTSKEIMDISVENIELFWKIDKEYIESVKELAKRMKDLGIIEEIPDVDSMFDLSFQDKAK